MSHDDLQMADGRATGWNRRAQSAETSGAETCAGAATEAASPSMDQWKRSTAVWVRLRSMDAADRRRADRAEVRRAFGGDGRGSAARRVGHHAAKPLAACLRARSGGDRTVESDRVPAPAGPRQERRRQDLLP